MICIENFKTLFSIFINHYLGFWHLRIGNELCVRNYDPQDAIFQQFPAVPGLQLLFSVAYTS
eukprot:SAG11_NODE_697_length_7684_cov_8.250231_9_plen_62_part_00